MTPEETQALILSVISDEKESFLKYKTACSRFTVLPDQVAIAVHQARIETLTQLNRTISQKLALLTKKLD